MSIRKPCLTLMPKLAQILLMCALTVLSGAMPAGAALVCPTSALEAGPVSGVVNDYWAGVGSPSAGSTAVTLGARRAGGAGNQINPGDLVLLIQVQDADVSSANSSAYGAGDGSGSGAVALNSTGLYEYVVASSAVGSGGGMLTLAPALTNSYRTRAATGSNGQSRWQAVRVPRYANASASNVEALGWDGQTGGVVGIDVRGTLTLSGATAITAAGRGFKGGAGQSLGGGSGSSTDFRTLATGGANGSKGEGIAGRPRYVNNTTTFNGAPVAQDTGIEGYPGGSYARGAPGNAGGGGTDGNPAANDQNTGGGGGSNYGTGGRGGNSWNTNLAAGGFGGAGYGMSLAPARTVFGGGGGAGTSNNATGDSATYSAPAGVSCSSGELCSSGAAGGGIVLIRAGSVVGSGIIDVRGADGYNVGNDGAGGGGGGGSVVLSTVSGGSATVNAAGGNGGNAWRSRTNLIDRHGPGGGGGGGYVSYSPAAGFSVSANVLGGQRGLTSANDVFGATVSGGGASTAFSGSIPGATGEAFCPSADLAVSKTHAGSFAVGAENAWQITVSNLGPQPHTGAITVSDTLAANFDFVSATGTGWSCAAAGQDVTCVHAGDLAAGASAPPITLTVTTVSSAGSPVANIASVTGSTYDSQPANNSSTDSTEIRSAGGQLCYAAAGSSDDSLVSRDTGSGAQTTLGDFGVSDVRAMAWHAATGKLLAVDRATSRLGEINTATGAFSAIGAGLGSGAGSRGTLAFNGVEGLAYDAVEGALYAVHSNGTYSVLFRIDPATGAAVENGFGLGIGYLEIGANLVVRGVAVDPLTGVMYGVRTGNPNVLLTVDKASGAATVIGDITVGWRDIRDMQGLGTDGTGGLWGVTGDGDSDQRRRRLYRLDKTSGAATLNGSVGLRDHQSVDCVSNAPVRTADVAAGKTASTPTPLVGGTATFTITAFNNGPTAATAVLLADVLPAGMAYVTHSTSQGAYSAASGNWYVGQLAVGASASLDITVTATGAPGIPLANTATRVWHAQQDAVPGNDSASVTITPTTTPVYLVTKNASIVSDPVNGGVNPKHIPGAVVEYLITVSNSGGVSDADSITVTDPISAGVALRVADLAGPPGGGPVTFADGATTSGLTYTFSGLASLSDDLEFSEDNGATWEYAPVPGANGCDPAVNRLRVRPKGVFTPDAATPDPSFSLRFQVCVN